MNLKIVLLDIDGVIAPVYSVNRDSYLIDIQWSKFTIPKDLAKFVEILSHKVEVIWASSWEESSYEISKKLNLNINKHLTFHESKSNDWFKISAIREFALSNQDKEILFLDDEAKEFLSFFNELKNLTIISPDDRIGLSRENIIQIKKWIIS